MEFTLYYRGELKANRGAKDKQALRRHFHVQLRNLWHQLPLKEMHKFLDEAPGSNTSIIKPVNSFKFVPVVTEKLNLIAELKITFLRPESPGSLITKTGDIDNRLKTLLDALKIPEPTALPKDDQPTASEHPFFCLLEDDCLITRVSVETDRLLDKCGSSSEVVLLIQVTTKATRVSYNNIGLS